MKPIRISLPKILRIAAIQSLTTISIGLLPLLACDVAKADLVKTTAGISATESATDSRGAWRTEVEAYNQRIAAFNRDVLTLQRLENEITIMTFEGPSTENFDASTSDNLKNAFVVQKNAKINHYNNLARSLSLRKAALERFADALVEQAPCSIETT